MTMTYVHSSEVVMKRLLLVLLFISIIVLVSCSEDVGGEIGGEVTDAGCTHVFDFENCIDEALKAPADCDSPAEYYRTCSGCGVISKADTDIFTFGEALGHAYEQEEAKDEAKKSDATCTEFALYFRSCVRCGICDTDESNVFQYGEIAGHSYTAETAKDEAKKKDATKESPAEYYKSCVHCGEINYGGETFFYGDIDLTALFREYTFLANSFGSFDSVSELSAEDYYVARANNFTVSNEDSVITLPDGDRRLKWVTKYDAKAMNEYAQKVFGRTFDFSDISKLSSTDDEADKQISYDAATQTITYVYVGFGGKGGGPGTYEHCIYKDYVANGSEYTVNYQIDIKDNMTDELVSVKGTGEIKIKKTDSGYVIISNTFKAN